MKGSKLSTRKDSNNFKTPIILYVLLAIILLSAVLSAYCFFRIFYSKKRTPLGDDEYEIPDGEIYEVYRDQMVEWIKQIRRMPKEELEVVSYDGLVLKGKYYEYSPDSTIEILFHGYAGNAERDLSGAVERCFLLGRSAILVDQRASGSSEGSVITFGVREHLDAVTWANFINERYDGKRKIILTGISMGASTVLMAAGSGKIPETVVSVIADCGYSSAKEIIKKVIKDMKLPPKLLYPFVKLGARIFGGFDLEAFSPIEAMENIKIPVIFIHGTDDRFVPIEMSEQLFDACKTEKAFVRTEGAGHGLAYIMDKEGYLRSVRDFEATINI